MIIITQKKEQNLEDFITKCQMVGKRIAAADKTMLYVILN